MKKIIALSVLALSTVAAQATMNVCLSLALQGAESVHSMTQEFSIDANEATHISCSSFEIDVIAQPVENEIELAFVINTKNEDGSCTLIAAPVIRTVCDKTAVVTMTNEDNTTLGMLVTVQENNQEITVAENQEAQ